VERRGRTRVLDGPEAALPPPAPVEAPPAIPEPLPIEPANSADGLIERQRRWAEELARYAARPRPKPTAPRQP
jgi:hypothetical protein